jgi:hypothetical protein
MKRLLLVLALFFSGCSISGSRTALPEGLEGAETLPIEGANGPMAGTLTIGEHRGPFRRKLTETTALEVYERDFGTTRLTLSGPATGEGATVECKLTRRAFTAQGVSVPTKPTSYLCTLPGNGRTVIDTEVEIGGPYPFPVRTGQIRMGETVLNIRSLHAYDGIEREAPSPLGYSFARGDVVVAALDNLIPPRLVLSPQLTEEERAAVLLAGGVLALAWEPDGA